MALLRGEDARDAVGDVRLLPFLNELCRDRPALRIYVLAWDFSVVYALEREWLQALAFDWGSRKNLRFVFDASVALEGSHHQKFAVIDGVLGFVGGTDICEHRWDDRAHTLDNPLRAPEDGPVYAPYHETHAFVQGPAVAHLVEFFCTRWAVASTDALELTHRATPFELPANRALPILARDLAFSRTVPQGPGDPKSEIRDLLTCAIAAAEHLIYVETQYFTSRAIAAALEARICDPSLPKLDIVFILPREPEAPKEALAMGVSQARTVARLRDVAAKTGHQAGFYCSVAVAPGGEEVATYIHSKLLVVDDRFLTLGSANLNNRSMGVDTELNVAFEADAPGSELARSIRDLRVSLLGEHAGGGEDLASPAGLVARLNLLASEGQLRLRHFVAEDATEADALLDVAVTTVGVYLDPEEPVLERDLEHPARWKEMFSRGISRLKARLAGSR